MLSDDAQFYPWLLRHRNPDRIAHHLLMRCFLAPNQHGLR
jgi:hypothetical protein